MVRERDTGNICDRAAPLLGPSDTLYDYLRAPTTDYILVVAIDNDRYCLKDPDTDEVIYYFPRPCIYNVTEGQYARMSFSWLHNEMKVRIELQ